MFKGDDGIIGDCCWEPPNSTVCAGDENPQTRYNYNTDQTETQIGIGTCGKCCDEGDDCPVITMGYILISPEIYSALRAGGSITGEGGASEYTGCSFSGTTEVANLTPCSVTVSVNGGETCTTDTGGFDSNIQISWNVAKVGEEYRMLYEGAGSCFSNIHSDVLQRPDCYTVGFFINSDFEATVVNAPFTKVGTGTITTSAGILSFGIWNLDPSATAFLDITITP